MDALEKFVTNIARWTAMAGGLVLVAITLITVVSITGRAFVAAGLGPVPGDFELVEAGTAFAVFSFLPWCLINRGHASVEIFTVSFPQLANRLIDLVTHILMLAVALLITWRHLDGTLDKYGNGETTFILQFPLWWAYAASLVGAFIFIIVAAFCLLRSLGELAGTLRKNRSGART
jgi:TRAP-type C4-dicarboxylate transport system permease small subunit